MKIDWTALGVVAVVSIVATILFVALLAGGIRLVAAGPQTSGASASTASGSGTGVRPARAAGFVLLGLAGLLVLFGIYLIMPFGR